jgi:hypothetical protein
LGADVTTFPGWLAASSDTKDRTLAAASRFIAEADPKTETWISADSVPLTAIVGFHALALLLVASEDQLNKVSVNSWVKWVPILLRCGHRGTERLDLVPRLLRRACPIALVALIEGINKAIDSENARHGHLLISAEIEACWDERLGDALLNKVSDPSLKPELIKSLFVLLIRHDTKGSRELAESFIPESALQSESERGRMLATTLALMTQASDAGWSKVWPIINKNEQFGRLTIESLTYASEGGERFVEKLSEMQLAELYIWMARNYPIVNRIAISGAMSSHDAAVMFRDSILQHLKRRGSFAACDAIGHIIVKFPQYTWLNHHLDEAELLARAATWKAVSPKQLLALVLDRNRRFVESDEELIAVILESLDRLQAKLHDELPAVRDLWNSKGSNFCPKDEQDVSDYIARRAELQW